MPISQRVLNIEDWVPKIEETVNATVTIKNIVVTYIITCGNIRKRDVTLYREGEGIKMTEGESATSSDPGIGKINESGRKRGLGSIFYATHSNEKLGF